MGANLRKEGIERGGPYAQMLAQSPLVVETLGGGEILCRSSQRSTGDRCIKET